MPLPDCSRDCRCHSILMGVGLALAVALATWAGWRWYLTRVAAAPEEATALVLTIIFLTALGGLRRGSARAPHPFPFVPLAVVLAVYALSFPFVPHIILAALAVAATLYALHSALFRSAPPIAFWGLIALSLPVLPSLQFVLGYPLRVVAATISVVLLQGQGLAVSRQGTLLGWQGRMVQFDAPCSGVNMLWAGLMLALMGAVLLRLDRPRTLAAIALATIATIAANALRGASLFYMEAGVIEGLPAWWHEATGLAAFLVAAVAMLWGLGRLQPGEGVA